VSVIPWRSGEKLAREKLPKAAPATPTVVVTPSPAARLGGL
jgi:hypothetical protein